MEKRRETHTEGWKERRGREGERPVLYRTGTGASDYHISDLLKKKI